RRKCQLPSFAAGLSIRHHRIRGCDSRYKSLSIPLDENSPRLDLEYTPIVGDSRRLINGSHALNWHGTVRIERKTEIARHWKPESRTSYKDRSQSCFIRETISFSR